MLNAQSVPSLHEFIGIFLVDCNVVHTRDAPVHPVVVPASNSASVAISTAPAIVVDAIAPAHQEAVVPSVPRTLPALPV